MSMTEEVVPPGPARTMEGLRDTGYTVETALADIIDNSIAANAKHVDVEIAREIGGDLVVRVTDDGDGMTQERLRDAMRYGSPPRPDAQSLGKFGLGLKTASTAICRQLTLTSRSDGGAAHAARWDLDYVERKDAWLLQYPDVEDDDLAALDSLAGRGSGTVVTWRKVDRMLPRAYKDKTGKAATKALDRILESLRAHLEMTYARFLAIGDDRAPDLVLRLNDKQVDAWDPLCLDLDGAELLLNEVVPFDLDGQEGQFTLRASVLPPRALLSDADYKHARISQDAAGFYVHREQRCISAGGWLGMYKVEVHNSLCRVDLSFDHRLDDAFQIDIKKSRIELLEDLESFIKQKIQPVRKEAETRYRKNKASAAVATAPDRHATSNRAIEKVGGSALAPPTPLEDGGYEVANNRGTVRLTLPSTDNADLGKVHVQAEESLQDGLLYQPGIVNAATAVKLNAGHPYYQRCYDADSPVTTQAIDFLLWAMTQAELECVSEDDKETMENMRQIVSRITRRLASQLPELE